VGGDLIYFYCLQLLYQKLANDSKNHSFSSFLAAQKNISFSNGILAFFNAILISQPK
jgi:hypothetical protein